MNEITTAGGEIQLIDLSNLLHLFFTSVACEIRDVCCAVVRLLVLLSLVLEEILAIDFTCIPGLTDWEE
uniref:Uncharacterized protein n=1 Tax=Helianthus annuus TaxID=4232 RepID=A0A251T141_HELAN